MGSSRVINDGPRPKHAQLRDALAELAATEGPDVAIPSERDLMAAHGVSRATVRKAIDGLVVRRPAAAHPRQGHLRVPAPAGEPAAPRVVQPGHAPPRAGALDPSPRRRAGRSAGGRRRVAPARARRAGVATRPGPARRRPADRARARLVPRAAAARADPARPRRLALRDVPRRLRAAHRRRRADAVGRGRRRDVRRPARRAAAHPTPCLPAGLHLGREAAGARRLPLSGRPLPAAHVTGPRRRRHQHYSEGSTQ